MALEVSLDKALEVPLAKALEVSLDRPLEVPRQKYFACKPGSQQAKNILQVSRQKYFNSRQNCLLLFVCLLFVYILGIEDKHTDKLMQERTSVKIIHI